MLRLPTENTSDREEKTMVDWIEKSLGEIAEVTKLAGFEFTKYIKYNDDGEIIALRALNLRNGELDLSDIKRISREVSEGLTRSKIYKDDILLTYTGNGYGDCAIIEENDKYHLAPNICKIVPNQNVIYPYYLYCYIRSKAFYNQMSNNMTGSGQPTIPMKTIRLLKIPVPDMSVQVKIANMIWSLNQKIRNNKVINNNLLEQVLTLYRNKFVDTANNERAICRADEYFDISIGKTPPRKEPQWFSTNPQDIDWVSISDMGTCGLYISNSSEQLTKEAVERHNVKVVPDNTVLLSFKLTVGRIAITNGEMTTNEAIAHFKTDKKEINEYLYCYLKCFNYQTMGSTSSIATAVNSKIIKGMPFVVPTDDELKEFHDFAAPMFAKIKTNQVETDNLTALRDTLLPKLMSGELDVSDIKL